jgi:hypothetical protein
MSTEPAMREEQRLARAEWERQQLAPSVEELWRRVLEENQARREPFPLCKRCGDLIHPDEGANWLFPGLCDACGIRRTEKLIRKIVKACGSRRRGLRALRRLAK